MLIRTLIISFLISLFPTGGQVWTAWDDWGAARWSVGPSWSLWGWWQSCSAASSSAGPPTTSCLSGGGLTRSLPRSSTTKCRNCSGPSPVPTTVSIRCSIRWWGRNQGETINYCEGEEIIIFFSGLQATLPWWCGQTGGQVSHHFQTPG